jgi:alpha,alpha-trehalase
MKCFFRTNIFVRFIIPFLTVSALSILWAACDEPKGTTLSVTTQSLTAASPDSIYGPLFDAIQMKQVFPDGKTFVDCTPKRPVQDILVDYEKASTQAGFNLKQFVSDNFNLPEQPPAIEVKAEKDVRKHIEDLWPLLTRQPAPAKEGSSLLPLPYPYIVPGGRFREVYYWDSYFTMLGLRVSGRVDMIENMVKNFAYLIDTYGHIPNGNRSYYLSRSQPPFFSLMVQLLAEAKKDDTIYDTYLPAIEKEYGFWMEGDKNLKPGETILRVVKMPDGSFMNHYWDNANSPRSESYKEDVVTAGKAVDLKLAFTTFANGAAADSFAASEKISMYKHLRAGAESGWDFSSRWFADSMVLGTIETTNIIPVDLNCLLYFTENLLAKQYARKGDSKKAADYAKWAGERQKAILQYCFDKHLGYFTDYNYVKMQSTGRITAAGLFPLCFFEGSLLAEKVPGIAKVLEQRLLADGGLLTTPVKSGQQWDAPNGWAPLQWMGIWGLERCGQPELAKTIATRWIKLNTDVFARTGKLMEKYNVADTKLEAGGGEYPGQDGFGWTNGVLLALIEKYKE